MKIVCLDSATLGGVDLSVFKEFGEFITYDLTPPELVVERLDGADVAMVNKVVLDEAVLKKTKLKLILETATGLNNIAVDFAKQSGIVVKNVADYSTQSVVQHTFALIFAFLSRISYYDTWTKNGAWCESEIFTDFSRMTQNLEGKKHGIIGLGTIGKKVARLSEAFGAKVCYHSTSGKNLNARFENLGLDELLCECEIISIHAPLNEKTKNLLPYDKLKLLKTGAILINVGRGGIVNETDLTRILDEREIYAGLDVLETEPMLKNHPLLSIKNKERLIITPHIAWASKESLQRLIKAVYDNLKEWLENGK